MKEAYNCLNDKRTSSFCHLDNGDAFNLCPVYLCSSWISAVDPRKTCVRSWMVLGWRSRMLSLPSVPVVGDEFSWWRTWMYHWVMPFHDKRVNDTHYGWCGTAYAKQFENSGKLQCLYVSMGRTLAKISHSIASQRNNAWNSKLASISLLPLPPACSTMNDAGLHS